MTRPDTSVDPLRAYLNALRDTHPTHHARLRITQRIIVKIHAAALRGWTTDQLVHETTRDHNGARNTAAVIQHRLDWAADHDPPANPRAAVIPFCTTECRDNQGLLLDPTTRLPIGKCQCRTQPAHATPEAP